VAPWPFGPNAVEVDSLLGKKQTELPRWHLERVHPFALVFRRNNEQPSLSKKFLTMVQLLG